jgi:hypothetical protein
MLPSSQAESDFRLSPNLPIGVLTGLQRNNEVIQAPASLLRVSDLTIKAAEPAWIDPY